MEGGIRKLHPDRREKCFPAKLACILNFKARSNCETKTMEKRDRNNIINRVDTGSIREPGHKHFPWLAE